MGDFVLGWRASLTYPWTLRDQPFSPVNRITLRGGRPHRAAMDDGARMHLAGYWLLVFRPCTPCRGAWL